MDLQLQYNHLVIPLTISIILIVGLILLGMRQRKNPVAAPFLFFMVCLLIWMVTGLFEVMTLNLNLSLMLADLSFLGITFFPIAWLSIVLTYLGRKSQFRRILPILVVIPIITNILIWTNPLHHLWRGESSRDLTTTWFPISIYDYGPWFSVVHMPFSLGLTFIAIFLLVRSFFIRERVYRIQISVLLIALLIPLSVEMLHQLGFQPIPHYNASTLVFPISGVVVGWSLLRFRFLDLTPIARELVVESMQDMMIVLDDHDRIIDLNPAAHQSLFKEHRSVVGNNIYDLLSHQSEFMEQVITTKQGHEEIKLVQDGKHQYYDIRISPITRQSDTNSGRLILLHNITDRKQAEQAIFEQAQQVAILEERRRLARELHDSVNQTLFAAQMQADLLQMAVKNKAEKVSDYACNIQELLHGTSAQMRLVLMELYPDALVNTDLGTSVKHLCDAYTGNTGTPVQFHTSPQVFLDEDAQIAFYRIAQEALHNINKHTNATQVIVTIAQHEDEVALTVQDNGGGFDVDTTPSDHFGLKNMLERATSVGAKFTIDSKYGHGTKVIVRGKI